MTFLNPLVLFGLAAAAIPLLLHLLNLRKLKTIEFSSLQFLKELQKNRIRRVKIRQLLLLIVRTLLVVALVMAFSRPALRGTLDGAMGTRAKSTMVVLLDDSPSMGVRNDRGVLFSQARETVGRILGLAKEGDDVHLVRLSTVRHVLASSDRINEASVDVPSRLSLSQETAPFRDAFGAAAKILSESKNFNQEIYLVSDGQATQFAIDPAARDTNALFDQRVRVFFVQIPPSSGNNSGITSCRVVSRILSAGTPVAVQAQVSNFSAAPIRSTLLNVYLDGSRVYQQSVALAAHGSSRTTVAIVPKRRGILEGFFQIDDDLLEIDNTYYFTLAIPEHIEALSVGSTLRETEFPALALTLGGDSSASRLFHVRRVTDRNFPVTDLGTSAVVILCGVSRLTAADAERIAQWVKAGTGLIVFPGKESDINNLNTELFSRLGIPPAGITLDTLQSGTQRGFLSFGNVDYDHPLLSGLFEQEPASTKGRPAIESPRVLRAIVPAVGTHGTAIIRLSDGNAFLTEHPVGAGRVLVFSVDAAASWSDFPFRGIFAPLMHRAVSYLSAEQEQARSFVAGDLLKVSVRHQASGDLGGYVITTPSGTEERVTPRYSPATGMVLFEFSQTSEVGVYELRHAASGPQRDKAPRSTVVRAIAVNVDPSESDTRRVTDEELKAFWSLIGVQESRTARLSITDNLDGSVQAARFGVELWKYCVATALLLAVLELFIARNARKHVQQLQQT